MTGKKGSQMRIDHLPRTGGIYAITNTVNGKFYIGSAVDLLDRARQHRKELNAGRHCNRKLQSAWRKYGSDAFLASVQEAVADPAQLVAREQHWITALDACKRGYNICPAAGSNLGLKWTAASVKRMRAAKSKPIAGFITPTGETITIPNVKAFCEDNGLSAEVFYGMAKGKVTTYRGWSHVNAKPKQREWVKTYEGFIGPDGQPLPPITNMEKFARERGLDPSMLLKVYRGKKPSHGGYRHRDYKPGPRRPRGPAGNTVTGFINPQGEPVTITNLARFCRENGLNEHTMYLVKRGKLGQHAGWTHADHPPKPRKLPNAAVHVGFVNPAGEPVTVTNMREFCKANGLSQSSMYRLKRGEFDNINGWTYRPPT